jgi:hypothetical protein
VTAADLDALIVAMQSGLESPSKLRDAVRRDSPGVLSGSVWAVLRSLAQRAEASQLHQDDERAREVYAEAGLMMDSTGAWIRRR